MWDQVAAFEDEPSMRALGYRPHFTLAIYDSPEVDEKTAWEAMQRAVNGDTQLRIAFKRISWFAGPPLVLWAEPTDDQVLARWLRLRSLSTGTSQCCSTWWIAWHSRRCG